MMSTLIPAVTKVHEINKDVGTSSGGARGGGGGGGGDKSSPPTLEKFLQNKFEVANSLHPYKYGFFLRS